MYHQKLNTNKEIVLSISTKMSQTRYVTSNFPNDWIFPDKILRRSDKQNISPRTIPVVEEDPKF
jgi:hypothetical protein